MHAEEYRKLSESELNEELLALAKSQLNLRVQKSVGEVPKTHLIRENRRNIARIKMILTEKAGVK